MPASTAYLFMWGLFTLVLFIGTLKLSRALQVVFGSLVILFFLLAYEHTIPGDNPLRHTIGHIAGYEGHFLWNERHIHRPRPGYQ